MRFKTTLSVLALLFASVHSAGNQASDCDYAAWRLKQGPPNIPYELQLTGAGAYTDSTMDCTTPTSTSSNNCHALANTGFTAYNTDSVTTGMETQLNNGQVVYKRFTSVHSDATWYPTTVAQGATNVAGTPGPGGPVQGYLGDCYILASIGSVARFENLRNAMFLNREKNDRGIYGVKFFIRGKPWVVAVDDRFFFNTQTTPHSLKFGASKDPKALWIPVMEKAWAKVKGNYANAQGGFVQTGFRYMTGAPFETFDLTSATYANQAGVDTLWTTLKSHHDAGYLIGAGTNSQGNGDSDRNACGVVNGHAYSVISAFELTHSGTTYKMLMVRNPHDTTQYTGGPAGDTNPSQQWGHTDTRWDSATKSQVPYGIDPTTSQNLGVFVVPTQKLVAGFCLQDIIVGYTRDSEGYTSKWYDETTTTGVPAASDPYTKFTFTTPANKDGDIYVSVESFVSKSVYASCTSGTYNYASGGNTVTGTSTQWFVDMEVQKGTTYIGKYSLGVAQMAKIIKLTPSEYDASTEYSILVKYFFYTCPIKEYTVRVYSKMGLDVKKDGATNMLHMDGQSPSGFVNSQYTGMTYTAPGTVTTDNQDMTDDGVNPRSDALIATLPAKSLLHVILECRNFNEFFSFVWYNPWIMLVWFDFGLW